MSRRFWSLVLLGCLLGSVPEANAFALSRRCVRVTAASNDRTQRRIDQQFLPSLAMVSCDDSSLVESNLLVISLIFLPLLDRLLTLLTSSSLSTTNLATTTSNNNNNNNKMSGIGFIGLGIMGEGMAARLISQGVAGTADKPLVVWNRTPAKCDALVAKFPDATITVVPSAAAVVQACGVTYSMLSTPEASAAVFDAAETGTLAGVSAGKSIVDCATLAEADMQRMNTAVTGKGGYVGMWHGLQFTHAQPVLTHAHLCLFISLF